MLTLTLALLLHLDPSQHAQIEFEQEQAQREVDAKYGNKKPSELTPDETRAKIRDQAQADTKVLEKFGTTPKEWARESLQRNRTQLAEQKQGVKALEANAKAAADEAKKPKAPQGEVQVQRGFSDESPVMLEEKPVTGPVGVEKSLPPDVLDEMAMARELDGALGKEAKPGKPVPAAKASKKAPAASKKKKKSKSSD